MMILLGASSKIQENKSAKSTFPGVKELAEAPEQRIGCSFFSGDNGKTLGPVKLAEKFEPFRRVSTVSNG
jgi:hypothetical protein